MPDSYVRPLMEADIDAAASVLRRSFADDPGLLFVLPDAADRDRLCPALARSVVRYALRYGSPLIVGDPVVGVALWFGPDDPEPDHEGLAELELLEIPAQIGPEAWDRLSTLLGHVDTLHHVHAPGPHWYLAMIGTDPDHQGTGIGRSLMSAVLDDPANADFVIYLETPNAHNVPYYQHRGLVVVGETDIPGSNVHLWMMRRDPREPGA